MLKRYVAALTALSLLASTPALADYAIKDGNAASQTFGSFSLSGVQFPKHVMVDPTTGAAIGLQANPLAVRTTGLGVGALTATPTASTNGTALGTMPVAAKGARLYVQPGGSITFTIAATAPSAAPAGLTITVANPSANTVSTNWDEDLTGGQMIYVTAGSGLFRWY